MSVYVLGLTGPSGAGKSTAAEFFVQKGFCLIDADALSRETLQPGSTVLKQLAGAFGGDLLRPDGTLDRRALADRAFADKNKTALLEQITHPPILQEIERRIEACRAGKQAVLLDAPLLFETDCEKFCTETVAVTADRAVRAARITQRDGLSAESAEKRLNAQPDTDYYRSRATYVIENNATPDVLFRALEELYKKIGSHLADDPR